MIDVRAVVAMNCDPLTQVDFSREEWHEWSHVMLATEGLHMIDLLPSMYRRFEIDPEQCIYRIGVDGRTVRNMWLRHEEKLEYVHEGGQWIPDTTIPPYEWQSPNPGGDRYWWIDHSPYTVGISLKDLKEGRR